MEFEKIKLKGLDNFAGTVNEQSLKVKTIKTSSHKQKNTYQSKHKEIDKINKGLDNKDINYLLTGISKTKLKRQEYIAKMKAYKLEQKALKNK